jgi:lysophospholipase L1-like esterase
MKGNTNRKAVALHERMFRGAISVEPVDGGWKPWRIPYRDFALYPPNGIGGKADNAAGVRLVGMTATSSVEVGIAPSEGEQQFDCVVDGELLATCVVPAGESAVIFDGLPGTVKTVEIYLDQRKPVVVTSVCIDEDAAWECPESTGPRWLTYGSSITQCAAAQSPALTWPAIVARKHGLDLTCLGYGANCILEPMVARMIRDQPADYISCCLGINVYGSAALSPRSFKPAVIGLLQLIREKHPETPLTALSPIFCEPRETSENKVGFTLQSMREDVAEAVAILQQRGDKALTYVSGADLFGEAYKGYLPDELHPNAEGYKLLAERFSQQVVQSLWQL